MKVLVITGGTLKKDFLKQFLSKHAFDHTIVVDGALKTAAEMNLCFQSLVGDFDTIDARILHSYLGKNGLYIEQHKPQKNETDTELAVNLGLETIKKHEKKDETNEIAILGATGGRLDHALGNIHLVYKALKQGISCKLYDEDNCLFMINRHTILTDETKEYHYVSFLPFTDTAEGVTLKGFLYPLENARLEKGCTLGISNEVTEEHPSVSVDSGVLIGILSRDHTEK